MKFAANYVRRERQDWRTCVRQKFLENANISSLSRTIVRPPRTTVRRELIGDRDQLAKYTESWSVILKVDGR